MRSRLTIALALTALAVTGCAPALESERADETQGFASVQDVQVQSLDDSTKDAPAAESPAFEPTPDEMGGYVFHVTMEPINDIECWERFSEKHLPVPGWVESRHPAHVFG